MYIPTHNSDDGCKSLIPVFKIPEKIIFPLISMSENLHDGIRFGISIRHPPCPLCEHTIS
jgi:hypothetical protein